MGKSLSLALASAFAFNTTEVVADSVKYNYGQLGCSYTVDNDTGRSIEMYGETDTLTDNTTFGFKYVIEFQKPNNSDPCANIRYNIELQSDLDYKRKKVELRETIIRLEKRIQDLESESAKEDNTTNFEEDNW